MVSLNDLVHSWGIPRGYSSYDEAKRALIGSRTQHEVSVYGGASSFNEGLYRLADVPSVLAEDSVLWLDAQFSKAGEPRVINQGTGGSVLDAKYGSVLGAYVCDGSAVLPGIANNFLSTPDAAALDITGDIDIRCHVALNDWTPAAAQGLVTKDGGANQRSYILQISTTGKVQLATSALGVTYSFVSSPDFPAVLDGEATWIRATLDVDNGAGSHVYSFYQSSDGENWTSLGSVTTGGATSIFASTGTLQIGNVISGSLYRAIIRDGIDGTTVLDVDLTNVPDYATSFAAVTGQTVTVNSTSSDTNDPLFLPHTGENYMYVPLQAGYEGFMVPSTGLAPEDLDVKARVCLDNYTLGNQFIIGKWGGGTERAWYVGFTNTQMRIMQDVTGDFSDTRNHLSSPFTGLLVSGQTYWFRWILDTDNGAGGTTARFFYAEDSKTEPVSWTEMGSPVITAGVKTINPTGTNPLTAGVDAAGRPVGKLFQIRYSKIIDSAPILDIDFTKNISTGAETSFVCSTGQTVTVNRATSGRKTALVTRPIWLFGTDDYMEVADNSLLNFAADESFTIMSVTRWWDTYINTSPTMSKKTGGANGAGYQQTNRPLIISDGTFQPVVASTITYGGLTVRAGVRDVALDRIYGYENNVKTAEVVDTTTTTLSNSQALLIGRLNANATYMDMEGVAFAVWDRALTADEIAEINTYYGTV